MQELRRRLTGQGQTTGLATVYRQLNALAHDGEAHVVTMPTGQIFRACRSSAHHHHLICEACGDAVEIAPLHEDQYSQMASDNGFTITRHQMEVFGLCSLCRTHGAHA